MNTAHFSAGNPLCLQPDSARFTGEFTTSGTTICDPVLTHAAPGSDNLLTQAEEPTPPPAAVPSDPPAPDATPDRMSALETELAQTATALEKALTQLQTAENEIRRLHNLLEGAPRPPEPAASIIPNITIRGGTFHLYLGGER